MRVKFTWIDRLVLVCIAGVLIGLLLPSAGDHDRAHRYPANAPSRGSPDEPRGGVLPGVRSGLEREPVDPGGRALLVRLVGLHGGGAPGVRLRDESDDLFVLSPTSPQHVSVKPSLVLMGWGKRRYLIAPHEIPEFRNAVIEGSEPRDEVTGRYFVRSPIEPAEGLPDSPRQRANAVREGLLLGKVNEVSSVGLAKIARVNVDLGVKDGVHQGDVLTVQRKGSEYDRRFRVVSVSDHSCVADDSSGGSSEHPVLPGMAVVAVKTDDDDGDR